MEQDCSTGLERQRPEDIGLLALLFSHNIRVQRMIELAGKMLSRNLRWNNSAQGRTDMSVGLKLLSQDPAI